MSSHHVSHKIAALHWKQVLSLWWWSSGLPALGLISFGFFSRLLVLNACAIGFLLQGCVVAADMIWCIPLLPSHMPYCLLISLLMRWVLVLCSFRFVYFFQIPLFPCFLGYTISMLYSMYRRLHLQHLKEGMPHGS